MYVAQRNVFQNQYLKISLISSVSSFFVFCFFSFLKKGIPTVGLLVVWVPVDWWAFLMLGFLACPNVSVQTVPTCQFYPSCYGLAESLPTGHGGCAGGTDPGAPASIAVE